MTDSDLLNRLAFIRLAEQLKDTHRSAHTATGKQESVAEHTWRLALLVMTYADYAADCDRLKLLQMCLLHDLGEIVGGDVPAPEQTGSKAANEREDFISLLDALPEPLRCEFIGLWDEYEAADTKEAKLAKALDKIETLLQHNQGKNPQNFNYEFNLDYGRAYTDDITFTRQLRSHIDKQTQQHAEQRYQPDNYNPVEIKTFVPASDYSQSKQFYLDIGFKLASDGGGIAFLHLENCSFLLQQVDRQERSRQTTMHLLVENVDHWHRRLSSDRIAAQYDTNVSVITDQPWRMRDFTMTDPHGNQWRVAQNV